MLLYAAGFLEFISIGGIFMLSGKELTDAICEYMSYVRGLENIADRVPEYDYVPCETSYYSIYDFMDTPNITELYTPEIQFIERPKCSKCDARRMISKPMTVFNEFESCECFDDYFVYECIIHNVVSYHNGFYLLDDGSVVNKDAVIGFGDAVCFNDPTTLYFEQKSDCIRLCDNLNGRNL